MTQDNKSKVYTGIGYYLKTLDNLLTIKMDSIHTVNGINRAEWQILNSIAEKPQVERNALLNIVKEFTDYASAERLTDGLIKQGLVTGVERLELTEKGQKVHTIALTMQKDFRIKSMQGISQEEYQQVIITLDKMLKNLSK